MAEETQTNVIRFFMNKKNAKFLLFLIFNFCETFRSPSEFSCVF